MHSQEQSHGSSSERMQRLEQSNKQLQQDKLELSGSIKLLNEYYSQKIQFLQEELTLTQERCEQLLQWKAQYVDRSMFDCERYELEIKQMIQIIENVHRNFEREKTQMEGALDLQQREMHALRLENELIKADRDQQEDNVETLAKKYITEIERLNSELHDLKEESVQHFASQPDISPPSQTDIDTQPNPTQLPASLSCQEEVLKDISNHDTPAEVQKQTHRTPPIQWTEVI